jgi:hypothetical protein
MILRYFSISLRLIGSNKGKRSSDIQIFLVDLDIHNTGVADIQSHSSTQESTKILSESISGSFEQSNHFRQEAMKSCRASDAYQRQAAHTMAFATRYQCKLQKF